MSLSYRCDRCGEYFKDVNAVGSLLNPERGLSLGGDLLNVFEYVSGRDSVEHLCPACSVDFVTKLKVWWGNNG